MLIADFSENDLSKPTTFRIVLLLSLFDGNPPQGFPLGPRKFRDRLDCQVCLNYASLLANSSTMECLYDRSGFRHVPHVCVPSQCQTAEGLRIYASRSACIAGAKSVISAISIAERNRPAVSTRIASNRINH